MPLTVENGTGLAGANAYVSESFVTNYFSVRGNETWAEADTATKEAAIVRATFALDAKYAGSWVGVKKTQTQALQWPRIDRIDSTTGVKDADGYVINPASLPLQLQNATAEVALIELTERFLSQGSSRDDYVTSETVGPISTTWADNVPVVKLYPHVDALLSGLASPAGESSMVWGLTDEEMGYDDTDDFYAIRDYFTIIQ